MNQLIPHRHTGRGLALFSDLPDYSVSITASGQYARLFKQAGHGEPPAGDFRKRCGGSANLDSHVASAGVAIDPHDEANRPKFAPHRRHILSRYTVEILKSKPALRGTPNQGVSGKASLKM